MPASTDMLDYSDVPYDPLTHGQASQSAQQPTAATTTHATTTNAAATQPQA